MMKSSLQISRYLLRVVCLVLCCFTVESHLCAQQVSSEEAETISVRFTCLAWDSVDSRGLNYMTEGEEVGLRISSAFRSPKYEYTGLNPFVIYTKKSAPNGESLKVPVASVSIDPELKDVLLLFVQQRSTEAGESAQSKYTILVMNESLNTFPFGSYRIFNFSERDVGGILGDSKFILPPKSQKVITPSVENHLSMQVHFSKKQDEQWVPEVNTRWNYEENARRIVFISEDTSSRRSKIKIKTISEYKEPR